MMPGEGWARQGESDSPHLQCEQLWGEQTRHSLLTYYYKQNTQQQFSQPGRSWHHSLLPLSGLPCPSLELETKKRIHHPPKRVGTIRQREPQYCDQSPSICSPPSLAWEPSYNGQYQLSACFLPLWDHSGHR